VSASSSVHEPPIPGGATEEGRFERAAGRTREEVSLNPGLNDGEAAVSILDNLTGGLATCLSALLEDRDEEDRQSLERVARFFQEDITEQAGYLRHLAEDESPERRGELQERAVEAVEEADRMIGGAALGPEHEDLSIEEAADRRNLERLAPGLAAKASEAEERLRQLRAYRRDGGTEPGDFDFRGTRRMAALLLRKTEGRTSVSEETRQRLVASADALLAEAVPTLRADDGDLAGVTDECLDALAIGNEPDPVVFRHAGGLSRIEHDEEGAPVMRPMTGDRVRERLTRVGRWRKQTRSGLAAARPPLEVARNVLATPDPDLPVLRRIVEVPVFTSDGTLVDARGFHEEAGVYLAPPAGFEVPAVLTRPTVAHLAEARRLIEDELLGDFPFVSPADRAHAVALLILPFARDLIDGPTPLHVVDKPTPGSGATLLLDAVVSTSTGRPVGAMAEGRDDDEWRKRITAALLAGRSHVVIDNVRRRLDSAALASAITAPSWEDRRLGASEMIRVPARSVWACSGNNVALSDEMTRRSIRLRLDPGRDRPQLRTGFRHPDLLAWVRGNRAALVWAALTMIRAWLAAGRPCPSATILGGFEAWSRVVGGVLEVAGVSGFLDNLTDFYAEAEAGDDNWRGLVSAWHSEHGEAEVAARDLVTLAVESLDLGEADHLGLVKRLGRRLREQRGRVFEDLRVEQPRVVRGSALWRVVRVDP